MYTPNARLSLRILLLRPAPAFDSRPVSVNCPTGPRLGLSWGSPPSLSESSDRRVVLSRLTLSCVEESTDSLPTGADSLGVRSDDSLGVRSAGGCAKVASPLL
jgi:hypothetical protein